MIRRLKDSMYFELFVIVIALLFLALLMYAQYRITENAVSNSIGEQSNLEQNDCITLNGFKYCKVDFGG